jgi:PadR family transcriptional regulator, regulatory protein PadR
LSRAERLAPDQIADENLLRYKTADIIGLRYRDSIEHSMLRDFFLGFVKIHILHHAAEEPIYGLAIIEELQRHGYELSPGTLYPILHGMERDGYLEHYEETVAGKVRKYYTITEQGLAALQAAKVKIRELVNEVIADSPDDSESDEERPASEG